MMVPGAQRYTSRVQSLPHHHTREDRTEKQKQKQRDVCGEGVHRHFQLLRILETAHSTRGFQPIEAEGQRAPGLSQPLKPLTRCIVLILPAPLTLFFVPVSQHVGVLKEWPAPPENPKPTGPLAHPTPTPSTPSAFLLYVLGYPLNHRGHCSSQVTTWLSSMRSSPHQDT